MSVVKSLSYNKMIEMICENPNGWVTYESDPNELWAVYSHEYTNAWQYTVSTPAKDILAFAEKSEEEALEEFRHFVRIKAICDADPLCVEAIKNSGNTMYLTGIWESNPHHAYLSNNRIRLSIFKKLGLKYIHGSPSTCGYLFFKE